MNPLSLRACLLVEAGLAGRIVRLSTSMRQFYRMAMQSMGYNPTTSDFKLQGEMERAMRAAGLKRVLHGLSDELDAALRQAAEEQGQGVVPPRFGTLSIDWGRDDFVGDIFGQLIDGPRDDPGVDDAWTEAVRAARQELEANGWEDRLIAVPSAVLSAIGPIRQRKLGQRLDRASKKERLRHRRDAAGPGRTIIAFPALEGSGEGVLVLYSQPSSPGVTTAGWGWPWSIGQVADWLKKRRAAHIDWRVPEGHESLASSIEPGVYAVDDWLSEMRDAGVLETVGAPVDGLSVPAVAKAFKQDQVSGFSHDRIAAIEAGDVTFIVTLNELSGELTYFEMSDARGRRWSDVEKWPDAVRKREETVTAAWNKQLADEG